MKLTNSHTPQQGATLITVLIIMLLTMTAVLAGYRASSLNEIITSNASDYQRAVAAAEAMIRDAEADIAGRKIKDSAAFNDLRDSVIATDPDLRCHDAFCFPNNLSTYANLENRMETDPDPTFKTKMKDKAACYGEYTGSNINLATDTSNAILACDNVSGKKNSLTAKAWYWIEAFEYTTTVASAVTTASKFTPCPENPYVYRITAISEGLKNGTRAVIKTMYVPCQE